jgi:signal transduction histidine kinase/FixJ family two-component response regulator
MTVMNVKINGSAPGKLKIQDFCDMEKFEQMLRDWAESTGLATVAVGDDGKYLTRFYKFTDFCYRLTRKSPEGLRRCIECDKKGTGIYLCHAGLVDFAAPITLEDGTVLGKILGGQVLPEKPDEKKYRETARELGIDEDAYVRAVSRVSVRTQTEIAASAALLANVISMFVRTSYQAGKNARTLDERGEIISSLGKLYFCDYYIDVENDSFIELDANKELHEFVGSEGQVSQIYTAAIRKFVDKAHRDDFIAFTDMATLNERMSLRESITFEFIENKYGWCRATFISVRRDEWAQITHAIFAIESIQEEKQNEIRIRRKLQEMAVEAIRANKAKTEFLSRMSHDLRTPLNGVIGLSEIALNEDLPHEEVRRYLREIQNSGKYLLSLINDVLDMSKIESRKLVLHPGPLSFDEFCATIKNVIDIQCAEKKQTFTIIPAAGDFSRHVMVDRTRFVQVILNLLTNSVKYTPEGGHIELIIENLAETAKGGRKRFVVRDDGVGMSEEFAAHAFDMFSQERDSDTNSGTGLGLSIVKSLVDMMGGTVAIDSQPGQGTTVTVELELEEVDAPCHDEYSGIDGAAEKLKDMRFLLCEDNAINTEITTMILDGMGITVDHAENGQLGLERFRDSAPGHYDAVLMDIRMPVMNGIETTRAIRSLDRPDAGAVPIIALTANAFDEDREMCIRAGMNGHIGKPVDTAELRRTLVEIVLEQNQREEKHYEEKKERDNGYQGNR